MAIELQCGHHGFSTTYSPQVRHHAPTPTFRCPLNHSESRLKRGKHIKLINMNCLTHKKYVRNLWLHVRNNKQTGQSLIMAMQEIALSLGDKTQEHTQTIR